MLLRALELTAFRNLADTVLEPGPQLNVLAGDNAQGKTNLLEAIYLLGTLRSFRASKLGELMRWDVEAAGGNARVAGRVDTRGIERKHEVTIQAGKKVARLDGKGVRSPTDYFKWLTTVLFTPDDLGVLRGSPGGRRRLLDRAVFNRTPAYLGEHNDYQRALKSRNAILKDGGPDDMLEIWDFHLARYGARVVARRLAYIAELGPRVAAGYEAITHTGLRARLEYQGLEGLALDASEADLHAALVTAIGRSRGRDRARQFSSVGPHADDLGLWLDDRDVRLYASQGQTRALALALKIAEIRLLRDVHGSDPILLLDDVSSELDPQRNAHLFDFLDEVACQCFLTTTHPEYVRARLNRKDYRVVNGVIEG